MAIEKVREYLKKYQMSEKIIELDECSATVEMAAHALNIEPGMVAKTLSFLINDKAILIVCAGDVKIDNSKFKHFFNTKAKMVPKEDVEKLIGHNIGGVCPFGINDGVIVYLDESLKKYNYVYPACGSLNSAIKLTIKELEEVSNYLKWIDVTK